MGDRVYRLQFKKNSVCSSTDRLKPMFKRAPLSLLLRCGQRRCLSTAGAKARPLTSPSWSLQALHDEALATAADASSLLSDATVLHVARLSHLTFTPGTPEFDKVRRSMGSVLASTQAVASVVSNPNIAASRTDAASAPAADAAPSVSGGHGLGHLTEDEFETLARARFAELRPDVVSEGVADSAEVLRHAAKSQGAYFAVPRVVGGE